MGSTNLAVTTPLFLALDQGGHGSRAAVYNTAGDKLAAARVDCRTERPQENFVEQSAAEILASFRTCLMQLSESLGPMINHIEAAGLACQGSTLVCWDKFSGEALSPVISWQDCRAAALLGTVDGLDPDNIHWQTGLRLSPHYGASKFHWCLQHLDAVQLAAAKHRLAIGPLASYLLHQLTDSDSIQVDASHAQRTLLWNLSENDWSEPLCRAFHINKNLLPHCRDNVHPFGRVNVGQKWIPLTVCLRDQGASLFAFGQPEEGVAYINIGTGAFIQKLTKERQAPAGILVSPLLFNEEQHTFTWEATVNGAGSAQPWLAQHLGITLTPQRINQALERIWPLENCNPRYFINSCSGLGAPYWRTDIPPAFSSGLEIDEKIVAWIESLIFLLHTNLQLLQAKQSLSQIRISGGLSGCDSLCQGLADISNLVVERAADTDSTLQGVACLAAQLPDHWQCYNSNKTFFPNRHKKLTQNFYHWQKAMARYL